MDNLHYVCVDVSSDYSVAGMIYYIYYRNMDALHYVSVYVSLDYSLD
jgi:hypothetical protein